MSDKDLNQEPLQPDASAEEMLNEDGTPVFRTPRMIGKIIKLSLSLFVAAVNILIIWRVFFSANIPKDLQALAVNEKTAAAYEQYGDALTLRYQDQLSLSYEQDSAGYFGVPQYVFLPEAKQVQVVFRYNNSTLRHLAEDYRLDEIPNKSSELFDVTLLKTTDITPDIEDDANDPNAVENIRFHPTSVKRETTSLYTYYRLVFDGVEIDEAALCSIFLDVYYINDLDYQKAPYSTLRLYDHHSAWIPYELTAADKKALKNAQTKAQS